MPNKYHAQKTTVDGITFDSKHEADRYLELKLLERAHKITYLQLQPEFVLQPQFTFVDKATGKTIHQRAIKYYADFKYFDVDKATWIVEDAKGMKTDVYKMKKKMLAYKFGIQVQEV